MPFLDIYKAQVDLLLRCLPVIARAEALALKGGTAINLFHLDMPRLSVDIDLTYLPVEDRAVSIANIRELLWAMAGEIPDRVRQAFVAYLAGHRRPIAELLAPNCRPIENLFNSHFVGMTSDPVSLEEIETARTRLFEWARTTLTEDERRFLLSVKQGTPVWEYLPFDNLERWPSIQWKLRNIRRMDPAKRTAAEARLREVLEL